MVAGGAAILGSHICERSSKKENDDIRLDSLFTGIRDNIEHLMDNHHFEVLRRDVTFPLYVEVDEI